MGDAKKCLLLAAAKLFSKNGLEKTSTRDLAKESRANISMISYYFGSKKGLYKQVMKDFAIEIQNNMNALFDEYEKKELTRDVFVSELEHIIDHVISMRKKYPQICQMLSREKLEGLPLSKDIHDEVFYPIVKKFMNLFIRAQQKKIVREGLNPALFFVMLTEGIFGFFTALDCDTGLRSHLSQVATDSVGLRKQILEIHLKGALL